MQRYELTDVSASPYQPWREMKEDLDGDWVRWEDVAAQAAEIERLRAERDDAREFAEENTTWIGGRCGECGHRFRFKASACPQCGASMFAPWNEPEAYPDTCDCDRCAKARGEES